MENIEMPDSLGLTPRQADAVRRLVGEARRHREAASAADDALSDLLGVITDAAGMGGNIEVRGIGSGEIKYERVDG